jgi:hypothetical protein
MLSYDLVRQADPLYIFIHLQLDLAPFHADIVSFTRLVEPALLYYLLPFILTELKDASDQG